MAVISYSNVKYINICKKFIASAQSGDMVAIANNFM